MAVTIDLSDLQALHPEIDPDKAEPRIPGALQRAGRFAPCIHDADFPYADAAREIICDAIARRVERGTGAAQTLTAGPFGQTLDSRQGASSDVLFLPAEIEELQGMCAALATGTGTGPVGSFPDAPTWP